MPVTRQWQRELAWQEQEKLLPPARCEYCKATIEHPTYANARFVGTATWFYCSPEHRMKSYQEQN